MYVGIIFSHADGTLCWWLIRLFIEILQNPFFQFIKQIAKPKLVPYLPE